MAGISGMGTSYNLPNYVGELFALTPDETPFLSAIGGLTGGEEVKAAEFEWSVYDLRDPSAERQRKEGETAPTAEDRVRSYGRNITEIHQEKVSVSYTKQAATGQISAANNTGVPGSNAVTNELDWQVEQAIKQVARDVELTFLTGVYNRPSDNTTARKTRGLLPAIQTNRTDKSVVSYSGANSATDTITVTHALSNGDSVVFDAVGAATGIVPGRRYFVVNISTTVSFKVSLTSGGSPITLGTASGIALHKVWATDLATSHIDDLIQLAYDNGGLSPATSVLMVNSGQKRAITKAYATAYGNSTLIGQNDRTVGGVAVDTVQTDFGRLGIMLNRHMPVDSIAVVALGQCSPVFLPTPGKGHFFLEELAKTGASEDRQLYGDIGLKYGNEAAHALLRGLKV